MLFLAGRLTSLIRTSSLLVMLVACDPYDPCEDKQCGDSCQLCDPDDSDCVETAVAKFCNSNGVCAASQVAMTCE